MKKLVATIVFSFTLIVNNSLFAQANSEDMQKAMSSLSNYSLAANILNSVITQTISTPKSNNIKNALAMDVFLRFKTFKASPFDEKVLLEALDYADPAKMSLVEKELESIKAVSIKNAKKYALLEDKLKAVGVAADTLTFAVSSYALVQNFKKLGSDDTEGFLANFSAFGNSLLNIKDIWTSSTALSAYIAQKFPKSTLASIWANNSWGKSLIKFSKRTAMQGLDAVLLGAQAEGLIYKYYRDKKIKDIRGDIFSIHKTNLTNRHDILEKLLELWIDKERAKEQVELSDIINILENYLIAKPIYSNIYKGATYKLSDMFLQRATDNDYISSHYNKDDFSSIRNDQKIDLALNALARISIVEDAELQAYLHHTVTNQSSVADIIFGAFDEGIYDIYDTNELLEQMFAYYDTNVDAYTYYDAFYRILLFGKISDYLLLNCAKTGKMIYDSLNIDEYNEEAKPAKIFVILKDADTLNDGVIKAKEGDKIEFIFSSSGTSATEFVKEAFDKQKDIVLWYDDFITKERRSLTLKVDDIGYTDGFYLLYLEAPSSEFKPINISYYDDEREGYITYDLRAGDNVVYEVNYDAANIASNETDQSYQECIANGGTEIGCKVGIYSSIIKLDKTLSYRSLVSYDKYLYGVTSQYDLAVIDTENRKVQNFSISPWELNSSPRCLKVFKNYILGIGFNDGNATLLIMKPNGFDQPDVVSTIEFGDNFSPRFIETVGDLGYFSNGFSTVVADLSDIENPKIIKVFNAGGSDIAVYSDYIYETHYDSIDRKWNLNIIDFKNGDVNSTDISTGAYLQIVDKSLLVSRSDSVEIYSLSNPKIPIKIDEKSGVAFDKYDDLYIEQNILLSRKYGKIIDLKTFDSFYVQIALSGGVKATNGKKIYIPDSLGKIAIYDVSDFYKTEFTDVIDIKTTYHTDLKMGCYLDVNATYIGIRNIQGDKIASISTENLYGYSFDSDYLKIISKVNDSYEVRIFDVKNIKNPILIFDVVLEKYCSLDSIATDGNYLYAFTVDGNMYIYNKSNELILEKIWDFRIGNVSIYKHFLYIGTYDPDRLKIVDMTNIQDPILVYTLEKRVSHDFLFFKDNFLYVKTGENDKYIPTNTEIYDISTPSNPNFVRNFTIIEDPYYEMSERYAGIIKYIKQYEDTLLVMTQNGYFLYETTDPSNPIKIGHIDSSFNFLTNIFDLDDKYAYFENDDKIFVIDYNEAMKNIKLIESYYSDNIYLSSETPTDGEIKKDNFTKEWFFSKDIGNFDIEVVSNNYINSVYDYDFIRDGKMLKIDLKPNLHRSTNELIVRFLKNGYPVKVNGSDTFWCITKTNHPPRFADAQTTQLVSATNEPAFLKIDTYDADGESVKLSIEDDAGGYVGFLEDDPNTIFASFNDGKTEHTIKIGLDDGKEKVVKELYVLQFDSTSVEDFYSDVDKDGSYPFDGIAFGTLKGVIAGQPDPNDPSKRIFRPLDNASMAEALAMIINAEKRASLIDINSSDYYMDIFPSWAMPYYTYARDTEAIDTMSDLSIYYPTKEEIAKIVVKTLNLDELAKYLDLNVSFSDEDSFSDEQMLYNAKVAKAFGLFFLDDYANPKSYINRAELAVVIERIFMMPKAVLSLSSYSGEYSEDITYELKDIEAQKIDVDYNLIDSSQEINSSVYIKDYPLSDKTFKNDLLNPGDNYIYALLDNNGVKNIVRTMYSVTFQDSDKDGVQDKDDLWSNDSRYAFDKNGNSIPDVLDELYDLYDYNADDTVTIGSNSYKVSDLIDMGDFAIAIDRKIHLSKGWNLVSIDKDMSQLSNDISVVWRYKEGRWSAYSPNDTISKQIEANGEIDSLSKVASFEGVWIYALKDIDMDIDLSQPVLYSQYINGWTLGGSNSEISADTLECQEGDVELIWKFKDNDWLLYSDKYNLVDIKTFDKIEANEGFWVNCR